MKWFGEHKLFSIIAGIVIVLVLIITASFMTAGGSGIVGRGVQTVAAAVARPVEAVAGGIGNTLSGIINFRDTQKENEELQQQNLELKLSRQQLSDLKQLSKAFDFEPYTENSKSVACNIIELDYSNPYVIFTVDQGKGAGIKKNDVVVNGSGLVGQVLETGHGWSKIKSVLSKSNNVSFKVLRDKSVTGVLKGNGKSSLTGYLLDGSDRIIKGDTLVTTGIGHYPEGIRIGKVSDVSYDDDQQLKTVKVDPTVNFSGLQRVAVFI